MTSDGQGTPPPPGRPRSAFSLRARLTIWVVAIFAPVQVVTQGVFWLYERSAIDRTFNAQLLARARDISAEVLPFLPNVGPGVVRTIINRELRFMEFEEVAVDIFDETGRSVISEYTSGLNWKDLDVEIPLRGFPRFRNLEIALNPGQHPDAVSARAVVLGRTLESGQRYAIVVATNDSFVRRWINARTQVATLSALIGIVAAAISGWFIAGIAVAPFQRLQALARRLGPESIGQPIDASERHVEVARLTSDLEDARRRIAQGFLAQERFLSNVSHELKTPIAVMLTEAETMNLRDSPPHVGSFVRSIRDEMSRLGRLVDSFLTLTRIRDGKGLANIRRYAANDLAMDCVANCSLMATQHRVRLHPVLLADDANLDASLSGEPDLLRTMLDNLIRNAIRFSPEHDTVDIALRADPETVVVEVRDRGPGVPPEKLAVIFDRFAQAEVSERKGRGHGLGLTIAQGIAELHGGDIVASNRPDGGCMFTITLPRASLNGRAEHPERRSKE